QQRTQRVGTVQRSVASAPDVIGPTPVDELVTRSRRQQHVTGPRAVQSRPGPSERCGIVLADDPAILDPHPERGQIALDAPPKAALVLELAPRAEAQLASRREHHGLAGSVVSGQP